MDYKLKEKKNDTEESQSLFVLGIAGSLVEKAIIGHGFCFCADSVRSR